jgi:hypothetical protein
MPSWNLRFDPIAVFFCHLLIATFSVMLMVFTPTQMKPVNCRQAAQGSA